MIMIRECGPVSVGNSVALQKRISINFKHTMQQAQELEEAADEMELTVTQNVSNAMLAMSYGWSGERADMFLKKYDELLQEIQKTTKDLYKAANSIRTAAAVIYAAETVVIQTAINRI